MEKIYWVNGWPNNGFGYRIFGHFVKTIAGQSFGMKPDRKGGKIIYAKKIFPLEEALRHKQAIVDSQKDSYYNFKVGGMGPEQAVIYEFNVQQLKEGNEFLKC